MMSRWRCLARTLILFCLLGTALTASAASLALGLGLLPDPSGEVARIGAWVVGVILGFLAIVAATVKLVVGPMVQMGNAANKTWLQEALNDIKDNFDALMLTHVNAESPHPSASETLHEPLREADEEMLREIRIVKTRLAKLTHAHNEAMKMERNVAACMSNAARAPRRSTDPPDARFDKPPHVPPADALIITDAGEEESDEDDPDQP